MTLNNKFELNDSNYFSSEANWLYCSNSQYKSLVNCPAGAMAELRGSYKRKPTDSMLIGSYVDAYFEGNLKSFKDENPEIFKKDGNLKAQYKNANQIIKRIARDKKMMYYLSGDKQVIKTGEVYGVPSKIKMDSYKQGKFIADLKVIKDFKPLWKNNIKMNFVEYWGYDFQGAFYQMVEGNELPFYLVCATKEAITDLLIIQIPQERLNQCKERIEKNINKIQIVKQSKIDDELERCEKCDYCKMTRKAHVISYNNLDLHIGEILDG